MRRLLHIIVDIYFFKGDENINNTDLILYHNYLRNRRLCLIFIKNYLLNFFLDSLNKIKIKGIRLLEVYDYREMKTYFIEKDVEILYINKVNDIQAFEELVNMGGRANSLLNLQHISEVIDYKCAILLDICYFGSESSQRFLFELDKFIPISYELNDIPFVNKNIELLLFGKNKRDETDRRVAVLPGIFGYGDAFYTLPIMQNFINNCIEQICFFHSNKITYEVYSKYLSGGKHVLLNNSIKLQEYYNTEYMKKPCFRRIYNLTYFGVHQKKMINVHNIEIIKDLLSIKSKTKEIVESYLIPSIIFPGECKLQKRVNEIVQKHKYVITIQFCTFTTEKRGWIKEYVIEFIKECHEKGIGVIALSKHPYVLDNVYDFSDYPIVNLVNVMKMIDLHVGIDSCFGHIAGVINLPSITIWNHNNPLRYENEEFGSINVSLRPIRSNISIYQKNNIIEKIKPKLLMNCVMEILSGERKVCTSYLSYDNSEAGIDCLIVD